MKSSFRDPIIYPGEPMQTKPGGWIRSSRWLPCVLGGEDMEPGTIMRFRDYTGNDRRGWECRDHAQAETA